MIVDFILMYFLKKWLDNHMISRVFDTVDSILLRKKNRKQVVINFSSLSIAYVI